MGGWVGGDRGALQVAATQGRLCISVVLSSYRFKILILFYKRQVYTISKYVMITALAMLHLCVCFNSSKCCWPHHGLQHYA